MMLDEDTCKIEIKLQEIHLWTHACLGALTPDELHKAHAVCHRIVDMLNGLSHSNPIKFVALFEALSIGSDVLEETMERPGSKVTIH